MSAGQRLLLLVAMLAGHGWGQQQVSPPPDCVTDIVRRLGWQKINMQYRPDNAELDAARWLAHFSRSALFVHPTAHCQACPPERMPPLSDGGLLFNPTPLWPPFTGKHWIHVVGDPNWRPRDGAAGWVSWLFLDGALGWRLVTLRWEHNRGNWVITDVGRCAEHHFVEDRPGRLPHAVNVGDWLLRGAMRGQHLRLGFGAAPPSDGERGVIRSAGYEDGVVMRDGRLQPGPQADIIQTLARWLGFSYSVHPVFTEGNVSVWERLITEVAERRLDVGLALLAPTPALRQRVSFLHPQQYVTKYATVRRPRLSSAGFDPGKPFAAGVWTLLVATLVVSSVCSWLTTCLVRRYRDGLRTVRWAAVVHEASSHVLQVAGILCQRGVELTTNSYAIGTLFLTLSVFSLLIYNFYTGVMLSYMAVLVPAAPFSSLSAATASGYRVRVQAGSQEQALLRSNSTALLRDMLAHSQPIVYNGPEEGYPAVAEAATSPKDMILTSDAFLAMDPALADPETCPLCYWPEPVALTPVSMVGVLNLHNHWMLNRYLQMLQETGVLNRWRRRLRRAHLAGSRLCSMEPQTAQYSQLGLRSVTVSFVLLLAGVLLALLLLTIELIVHRLTRRRSDPWELPHNEARPGPWQLPDGEARYGPWQLPDGEARYGPWQLPDGEARYGPWQLPDGEARYGPQQLPDGEARYGPWQLPDGEARYGPQQLPDGEARYGQWQLPDNEARYGPWQLPDGEESHGP